MSDMAQIETRLLRLEHKVAELLDLDAPVLVDDEDLEMLEGVDPEAWAIIDAVENGRLRDAGDVPRKEHARLHKRMWLSLVAATNQMDDLAKAVAEKLRQIRGEDGEWSGDV